MQRFDWRRLALGSALAGVTGYALMAGNETLLPTALVCLLLFFNFGLPVRLPRAGRRAPTGTSDTRSTSHDAGTRGIGPAVAQGRGARAAIAGFAAAMATLSLLVSLFLKPLSDSFGWGGLYDGDFVRVTTNDAHEFAYATFLLLLLQAACTGVFRRRQAV